jgi:streptomycin 6-kinase
MNIDPSRCASKILDIHGAAGAAWLERLPGLVAECARRWSLSVLPPFDYDAYHYVCPAVRSDGTDVVLKLGVPDDEFTCQVEALRIFNGDGMVRLLDAEPERGILLLERLLPGTMLVTMEDDARATEIAGQVMRCLWKPVPATHNFPSVAKWAAGFNRLRDRFGGGCGPLPPHLIDRAEQLFRELLAAGETRMLLHGDVNPYNILQAQRKPWLVIDPKGVVGHPLFDAATYLNNLPAGHPTSELRTILARRVAQLAGILGYDARLVSAWGQAHCILSSFWTFEDHGQGWEQGMEYASLYDLPE